MEPALQQKTKPDRHKSTARLTRSSLAVLQSAVGVGMQRQVEAVFQQPGLRSSNFLCACLRKSAARTQKGHRVCKRSFQKLYISGQAPSDKWPTLRLHGLPPPRQNIAATSDLRCSEIVAFIGVPQLDSSLPTSPSAISQF